MSKGLSSWSTVLVRVSIPAKTSWQEASWGGKGLFGLHFHAAVHHQGSQDWNSSRSGSRSWCRGHGGMWLTGLLPLACSACFLIEPKTTSLGWHHPQWALPPWSLIEKTPYRWISWRHFLKRGSFLCDNSSLCQVDTKVANTLIWYKQELHRSVVLLEHTHKSLIRVASCGTGYLVQLGNIGPKI